MPFAKDVLGLDDVSGGRFLLGLGAGGEGFDATVTGPAPSRGERTRRFEEFVELLDALLTRDATEHTGEFYEAHDARMIPGTIARPRTPFVVAAAGPRTMALAARFGQGWVTSGRRSRARTPVTTPPRRSSAGGRARRRRRAGRRGGGRGRADDADAAATSAWTAHRCSR